MGTAFVHPTAILDRNVLLGEDTKIWHFVHVSEGARIGAHCVLGQNVFVGRRVQVGNGVKIQNNVSVYEGVTIADDVFLGPSCVFTNVTAPRAFIEQKQAFAPTMVGRGATVGANATIVCGHDLGEYCFVGAGCVVPRGVRAHEIVVGNPARHVGWACVCGQRLPSGSRVECTSCGSGFDVSESGCSARAR